MGKLFLSEPVCVYKPPRKQPLLPFLPLLPPELSGDFPFKVDPLLASLSFCPFAGLMSVKGLTPPSAS